MNGPPPLPSESTHAPPPLPVPPEGEGAEAARHAAGRRKKTVLAVVIGLLIAGAIFFAGVVGFGVIYAFSAQDVEVSAEIEASVLTIHDVAEWFELDVKPELEYWDTDFYFDRSALVSYYYNDEEESVYLNCNLTYEPKRSDALVAYEIEWGALKLKNRIGPGDPIVLDEQSDLFRWGDASRFAFQLYEGERNGLAFVARKGGKVFFLDCWGIVLEDKDEIADFIGPHLEALEQAEFRKHKAVEDATSAEADKGS